MTTFRVHLRPMENGGTLIQVYPSSLSLYHQSMSQEITWEQEDLLRVRLNRKAKRLTHNLWEIGDV